MRDILSITSVPRRESGGTGLNRGIPMEQSESIKSLAAALCEARANFPEIKKDAKADAGSYTYRYATLDKIISAIIEPLGNAGLSFIQSVGNDGVTLLLAHTSGEWIRTDPMPVKCSGNTAQAYGSAISYAKRYQICAVFGITADEDDDGNGADGNGVQQRQQPARTQPAKPRETVNKQTGEVTTAADLPDYSDPGAFRKAVLDAFKVLKFNATQTKDAIGHILDEKKIDELAKIPQDGRHRFVEWIRSGNVKKHLSNGKKQTTAA